VRTGAGLAASASGSRHRVSRFSRARRLEAAPRAVAALDPPPVAKTTRKRAPAAGHCRTRRAQVSRGRGRSCSQSGILSAAVRRAKIDSIDARSGSDRRSARSARRRSRPWRQGSVTGRRWSARENARGHQALLRQAGRLAGCTWHDRYPVRQRTWQLRGGQAGHKRSSIVPRVTRLCHRGPERHFSRKPCTTVHSEQEDSPSDSTLRRQIAVAAVSPG